jgi:molybdate transport system regulatory protein
MESICKGVKRVKIAYKVWLDNNGKAFGEGPYRILKQIEKAGSLHQAAIDLNISYRKAWTTLQNAEKKLGIMLIDRKVGGVAGGGSHMTFSGKTFMKNYEKFRTEIEKVLEKTYQKHFGT